MIAAALAAPFSVVGNLINVQFSSECQRGLSHKRDGKTKTQKDTKGTKRNRTERKPNFFVFLCPSVFLSSRPFCR
jgi:hypothetical protein